MAKYRVVRHADGFHSETVRGEFESLGEALIRFPIMGQRGPVDETGLPVRIEMVTESGWVAIQTSELPH